ncbi:hypothetical protein AB3U87_06585 [Erwinia sp. OPT-41]|jgi:hypothetical protein|uniref:Uncharacterized protein n=1 Tax=Erwinia plantamica TaxID=3237104 RepID=A0ABW7CJF6_9GAMM
MQLEDEENIIKEGRFRENVRQNGQILFIFFTLARLKLCRGGA